MGWVDDLEFFIIVTWLITLTLFALSLGLNSVRLKKEMEELKKVVKGQEC